MLAHTDIAFGWLAQHGIEADRIGVVGFELGGAVSLVVAASRSIGAAVSVAGGGILQPASPGLPALVDVASELRCPWLGLYGDKVADEVALLREAAKRSETANDVVLYPAADHRFDIYPDTAHGGVAAGAELVRRAPALTGGTRGRVRYCYIRA